MYRIEFRVNSPGFPGTWLHHLPDYATREEALEPIPRMRASVPRLLVRFRIINTDIPADDTHDNPRGQVVWEEGE